MKNDAKYKITFTALIAITITLAILIIKNIFI